MSGGLRRLERESLAHGLQRRTRRPDAPLASRTGDSTERPAALWGGRVIS